MKHKPECDDSACYCLDDRGDPMCICGEPAWACKCGGVQDLQRSMGVPADGIWGPASRRALQARRSLGTRSEDEALQPGSPSWLAARAMSKWYRMPVPAVMPTDGVDIKLTSAAGDPALESMRAFPLSPIWSRSVDPPPVREQVKQAPKSEPPPVRIITLEDD